MKENILKEYKYTEKELLKILNIKGNEIHTLIHFGNEIYIRIVEK